jgi:hypothetical protein
MTSGSGSDDFLRRTIGKAQEPGAEPEPVAAQTKIVDEPEEAEATTPKPSAVIRKLKPRPAKLPLRTWDEVRVPAGANELEALTYVPGLVGDVIEWIVGGARRPNRMMSLASACAVVGTLVGRYVMGPTESATHLYTIILAPSGYGKDHPLQAGAALMNSVSASALLGPHEFASGPGFEEWLAENPGTVCFIDELGDELAKIKTAGNPWLNAMIGLLKKSYNAWTTIKTASKVGKKPVLIRWPAVSIVGAATPEMFFGSLSDGDLESGYANRKLILPFEGYRRPPERAPEKGATEVPKALIDALLALPKPPKINPLDEIPGAEPPRLRIEWDPGAEAAYFRHSAKADALEDVDPQRYLLSMRACENGVRLATIVAVGRGSPTVDVEDIEWAMAIAWHSVDAAVGGVDKFMRRYVEFPKLCDMILDHIAAAGGWAFKRDIERAFRKYSRHGFEVGKAFEQLRKEERIRPEDRRIGASGPEAAGFCLLEA